MKPLRTQTIINVILFIGIFTAGLVNLSQGIALDHLHHQVEVLESHR